MNLDLNMIVLNVKDQTPNRSSFKFCSKKVQSAAPIQLEFDWIEKNVIKFASRKFK